MPTSKKPREKFWKRWCRKDFNTEGTEKFGDPAKILSVTVGARRGKTVLPLFRAPFRAKRRISLDMSIKNGINN
jgi:hypothetical protein